MARPMPRPAPCAGFEMIRAFEQDAADFAKLAQTKSKMSVLVLSGEKAGRKFLNR